MFLRKLKDFKFNLECKIQRFLYGYSNSDCWDMHYWLGDTFPKMIRKLRDTKMGAPDLDFEEFDSFPTEWIEEQSKILLQQKKEKGLKEEIVIQGKEKIFDRWWFILSRIAYCLEQSNEEIIEIENEHSKDFMNIALNNKNSISEKEIRKKYIERENEIFNYRNKMKDEAFILLQKYFWHLWD